MTNKRLSSFRFLCGKFERSRFMPSHLVAQPDGHANSHVAGVITRSLK